jgi:hypothetical protein
MIPMLVPERSAVRRGLPAPSTTIDDLPGAAAFACPATGCRGRATDGAIASIPRVTIDASLIVAPPKNESAEVEAFQEELTVHHPPVLALLAVVSLPTPAPKR